MKTIQKFFIVSISATLLSSVLLANEGREYYLEADCKKCHNIDQNYDPKNSKATNLFDLKKWVSSCAVYFDVAWYPDEEESVVKYLNETYYKFKK